MSIKLGKIPLNVFISVKRAVTNAPEITFNVLCGVRFAGFNKRGVGGDSPAVPASNETVIGKIVLTGDPLGHPQIIATALATVRDRLKSLNYGCVVHV